jgi:hypothetical protein
MHSVWIKVMDCFSWTSVDQWNTFALLVRGQTLTSKIRRFRKNKGSDIASVAWYIYIARHIRTESVASDCLALGRLQQRKGVSSRVAPVKDRNCTEAEK